MLVENQCVDVVDNNWDLSFLEENLELLPVVLFLRIILSIIEAVHLDLGGEVSGEDLSDEEAVVEGSSNIFNRIR